MFHPPGRVAVPDRLQSVSGLNSGARGWEKERKGKGEKERERKRKKPISTFSSSMKCIRLLGLTCCIDMKNIDFRQNETLERILENILSTDVLWSGDSRW